ncbi:MAG: SulP family inorganic anion transporter [Blastocatellales bacterium]
MPTRLEPKLVTVFREGYSRKQFTSDLIAGVIVGIVALPLAIAFAIASGVKPEQGLYTAVIAGFIIGALGGTRAQISGPTGAFIVIIYGIVQQYGYEGLAIATIIAGFILIAMGLMKMGAFLKFIPYPVTVGFTTGIALIIFSGQIRDFFGLRMQNVPADFIEKWEAYVHSAATMNWRALAIGATSLLIVFLWPRVTPKIPGSLIAIIVATAAVQLLDLNVETIGSRFGGVPNTLPAPHLPHLSWALITKMFSPAITIALLAAIESLLAAVVADGMMGTRHRSNMELIAQGVGNIISPVFQGIPATGAIARTATNIKSGGRTPVAAIVHALTLLLIMLFFGKWAALIPMPTLAAILIFVAYNMSEYHAFLKLLKSPKSDVIVLLVTFALTVLIDLTVAIQVGVVLAAFLFLQRMSEVAQVSSIVGDLRQDDDENPNDPRAIAKREVPHGVEVFEIFGSLFFGAIERFKDAMRRVEKNPKVLIIRMRMVPAIDATGLQVLEDVFERTRREGGKLLFTGVAEQPLKAMEQSGLLERIGRENILPNIDAALERAREILELGESKE